jgi:hypothetical protein
MSGAWDVFLLFTIPVGGGIPAGVLLARKSGIGWPAMEALYLVSDVALALVFEPMMLLLSRVARRFQSLSRVADAFRESMRRSAARYGTAAGPLALVLIAFGVDPMTGRTAAAAAGHGFFSGWALAITGDMMYFTVIMISTLSLRSVLGDGTATTVVILLLMMGVPYLLRRRREGEPAPETR